MDLRWLEALDRSPRYRWCTASPFPFFNQRKIQRSNRSVNVRSACMQKIMARVIDTRLPEQIQWILCKKAGLADRLIALVGGISNDRTTGLENPDKEQFCMVSTER